jgi:LysR family glycine cleavage system transcriptional activator
MTASEFHVIRYFFTLLMNWIHALIPNLPALRALISLSETGSITRTAESMSLTQSAVSHKMKALETDLGFTLLQRDGRGIKLTHRAAQYVAEIVPALDVLAKASGSTEVRGTLRLNVAPGFAAYWLAPRLSGFTRNHPELRIHLDTARVYGDLGAREDDIYISFANQDQVPGGSVKLLDVAFFPVASPALLAGQAVRKPTDILDYPLLHLDGIQDWQGWFDAVGVPAASLPGGVVFRDMQIMQAAAIGGQGVALGDPLSCGAALAQGELIRAHEFERTSPRSYWLIEGKGPSKPAGDAFSSWLTAAFSETS